MKVSTAGVVAGIVAVVVAAVCIRLGLWQLDRLEQRRELNASLSSALAEPPIELDSVAMSAVASHPEAYQYRRSIARGTVIEGSDLLLRGRSHNGSPGVHLTSILRAAESGQLVLVNRGWLPSPDAATLDPRPFALRGRHVFEGILRSIPDAGADASPLAIQVADTAIATFRRLDYRTLVDQLDLPLLPLYLEATSTTGGEPSPVPVPLPALDEGPHLGYAFQWFSFAAIAVLGYLTLVGRWLRQRPGAPLDSG